MNDSLDVIRAAGERAKHESLLARKLRRSVLNRARFHMSQDKVCFLHSQKSVRALNDQLR